MFLVVVRGACSVVILTRSELERNLIVERVRAGLRRAKLEGRPLALAVWMVALRNTSLALAGLLDS
jgi:hypothetical protein